MTFALGIPHTPWIPERVDSLARLADALYSETMPTPQLFAEREPNHAWSKKMWEWGVGTGADHFVQVQDDTIPAPSFWPILSAMVAAAPDSLIALQGAHPIFRALARDGHHWAQSSAWVVGCGYVIPRALLVELVAFREANDAAAKLTNEDEVIAAFAMAAKHPVLHPIPTIIKHDVSLPSTYGNDGHIHRTATVTWEEYGAAELVDPAFWRIDRPPPIVTNPHLESCWLCQAEPSAAVFPTTTARVGVRCMGVILRSVAAKIGGPA